jgi:MFS family permease
MVKPLTVSMLTPWLLNPLRLPRHYVGCMVLLSQAALPSGLANDFGLVLAARVAEGLARWCDHQPSSSCGRLPRMGRAAPTGCSAWCVVLAPALGPSIGGVLVDMFGRSIFHGRATVSVVNPLAGLPLCAVTAPAA